MWRRCDSQLMLGLLSVWPAVVPAGPVLWAPTPGADAPCATVCLAARFDMPAPSAASLPPPPNAGGALARVQKGESIVWYGWSAEGWVELCGAGAEPDRVEVRMAFSETGVAYGINGTSLVSARTGEATLPRGQGAAVTGVTGRGAGRLYAGGITGSCFDATNALAAAGGRVTVLAGTPAGVYPLVSANGASWRQRVSVEGPRETLCSLVPNGGDGLDVAVGPLPLDEGRCVLAFTVATNAVGFVRGLADETTGSDHMLFLNGGGRLVLSGENEISGGIVIEDGVLEILETNAVAASSEPLLWSETAIALSAKVDRLELVERVTTVEEPAGRVVRKVAFSPVLATGSSAAEPFVVTPTGEGMRTVTFVIGNATRGFDYCCCSSTDLTGRFMACAERVTAAADGTLTLTVRVPAAEAQRFFRLGVCLPVR